MYKKSNTYLENLEAFQNKLLETVKSSFPSLYLKQQSVIEKSILKTSNQYVFDENKSLWGEESFDDAYLAYFIFTQSARLYYTFWRIQDVFNFNTVKKIIDFGSGPSTARLAFESFFGPNLNVEWTNIDSSKTALKYGKRLEESYKIKSNFVASDKIPKPSSGDELLLLSFSNCEGLDLKKALEYKNILILEPGQQIFSKRLISFRTQALEANFNVLAPCPHQDQCSMAEGKKNWCHDTAPKPKHINTLNLPFSKNRLNFSYLLLSQKTQNPLIGSTRIIGDLRQEKGKTKVAICRGKKTEFLSWLKKSKLELQLYRGDLIKLPNKYAAKGQEVRIEEQIRPLS